MEEFKIKIQFITEYGHIRNIDEIVLETKNLIDKLLQLKDVNLIKTDTIIDHDRSMTQYSFGNIK